MSDPADYTRQIELGKLIVTQYIKARPDSADQIYAMRRLPQDADALARNLWRLQLFLGARGETISFPVENLADVPGKPDGDGVLKQRGDQSLDGVQNRAGEDMLCGCCLTTLFLVIGGRRNPQGFRRIAVKTAEYDCYTAMNGCSVFLTSTGTKGDT